MAMIKPIALSKNAFDATQDQIFYFTSTGGNQVVKNKITIRLQSDNSIVYTNTIISYKFNQTIELKEAIWQGIFHSVSAFNNAGFSLFTDSMIGYKSDTLVLSVLCFLIVLGGLGYFVVIELHNNKKFSKRITIHTRIVLIGTIFLILFGAILFLSI